MKVLVEINHPAHVHLYKNLCRNLINKGHSVRIIVKDLLPARLLLQEERLDYTLLPAKARGLLSKVIRQIRFNFLVFRLVRRECIDIGIGTSFTIAQISRVTRMHSIIFDDDDDSVQPFSVKWLHPYADSLLSPESMLFKNRPRKAKQTIYYNGFHELAYLHPNSFIPDPNILDQLGLQKEEIFFILRFNSFSAHHDVGEYGLTYDQKLQLIELLESKGRIFVSTESAASGMLEKYTIPVSNSIMHDLLYFATIFIGDSQTMTSEAAILGTPSIRCNTFVGRIAYLDELEERYQLTHGYQPDDFESLLIKVSDLLAIPDLKKKWRIKRDKLLSEKIDVSQFMTWFVESYPESNQILKRDPDFYQRFIYPNL